MALAQSYTSLPTVIDTFGSEDFAAALLDFIRCTADFDSAVIMAYPATSELQVVHNALHAGDQSGFSGAYRNGLWVLSPLYLSAKAGVRGYFHILGIAPTNFRNSEHYTLYYSSMSVQDHTGFLVESDDGTPLAISLERTPKLPPISNQDKVALRIVAGTVAALVRHQWPGGLGTGKSPGTGKTSTRRWGCRLTIRCSHCSSMPWLNPIP